MPILKNYIEGTLFNQLKYENFNSGRGPIIQKKIPTQINERRTTEPREILKRADDTVRIAKLLTRPPGLKYAFNQNALGKVQTNSTKVRNLEGQKQSFLKDLGNGLFNTVKILGSTLAQVPVNGTGLHFVKGFAGRQGYIQQNGANIVKNGGIVNDSVNKDERNLRLAVLGGTELTVDPLNNFYTSVSSENGKKVDNAGGFIPQDGVSQPTTLTEKYRYTSEFSSSLTHKAQAFLNSGNTFTDVKSNTNSGPINFIKQSGSLEVKYGSPEFGNAYNKSLRKDKPYYTSVPSASLDSINILGPTDNQLDIIQTENSNARDLIKFSFTVVTPGVDSITPNLKYLHFRAFLDEFSDNYTGAWNDYTYVGRGEKFYTYQGFDRDIGIGFKAAAMSRAELKPIYQKLVYLASTTAPTYNVNGFMRGTFVRATVGDYLVKQPAVVTSVNYSWDISYPWEVKADLENEKDTQQLPHILNVTMNLKPIHNFVPETGLKHYFTNPSSDPFFEGAKPLAGTYEPEEGQ